MRCKMAKPKSSPHDNSFTIKRSATVENTKRLARARRISRPPKQSPGPREAPRGRRTTGVTLAATRAPATPVRAQADLNVEDIAAMLDLDAHADRKPTFPGRAADGRRRRGARACAGRPLPCAPGPGQYPARARRPGPSSGRRPAPVPIPRPGKASRAAGEAGSHGEGQFPGPCPTPRKRRNNALPSSRKKDRPGENRRLHEKTSDDKRESPQHLIARRPFLTV